MARTRYAYVPRNIVSDPESDAVYTDDGGLAGRLIATIDGSEPAETKRETLDGRYAIPLTRREAERLCGREACTGARDDASLALWIRENPEQDYAQDSTA